MVYSMIYIIYIEGIYNDMYMLIYHGIYHNTSFIHQADTVLQRVGNDQVHNMLYTLHNMLYSMLYTTP